MTMMRGFSPLDIMTLRDVRDASEAGAGIVALDVSLGAILWANGAGRTLLGLTKSDGELPATSLQGRQIRAASRLVEARGEARILLRPAAGLASKPVVADLKRITAGDREAVLLTAPAMRQAETSNLSLAERMLGESGIEDAAIYGQDGLLTAASGFRTDVADVPLDAVAALISSGEERHVVDGDGYRTLLSRIASSLVLVRRESVAPVAVVPEETAEGAEPGAKPPSRTAGLFSVKRQKLPAGRGGISMSALVQRWHRRQDDTGVPPAETSGETETAADGEDAAFTDGDAASADTDARSAPAGEMEPATDIAADDATERVEASGEDGHVDTVDVQVALEAEATPVSGEGSGEDSGTPTVAVARPDVAASDGRAATADMATPATPSATTPSATTPLRSRWGVPAGDAGEAAMLDEVAALRTLVASAPGPIEDDRIEAAETPSALADTPSASDEPAAPDEEPAVDDAPIAVPNDLPDGTEGEAGQPVEKESVVILPDVPPEDAPGLDVPISDDAEFPDGEAMVPAKEDAPPTDLAADADADARDGLGEPALAPADGAVTQRFEPRFDIAPVRFVWQIDREGKFHSLSSDFAAAVGPKAAAVVGLSFREVANVFGFDVGGEIARLLDRRDTWSGRSIFWPVEGSGRKVPVDLAALPVYARDRSFDGFRGFGIVKMNEAVADADAVGLLLSGEADHTSEDTPEPLSPEWPEPLETPETPEQIAEAAPERPLVRTFEADLPGVAFGRRQEPPQPSTAQASESEDTALPAVGSNDDEGEPKVIRLEERRRPRDGMLSQAEEAAFRAIGMKLGQQSEAETPGALRFVERPADAAAPAGSGPLLDESGIAEAVLVDTPAPATAEEIETSLDAASPADEPPVENAERLVVEAVEADPSGAAAADAEAGAGATIECDAAHEDGLSTSAETASEAGAIDEHRAPGPLAMSGAFEAVGDPEADRATAERAAAVEAPDETSDERSGPLSAEGAEDEEPAERPFDAAAMAGELEAIFASLPLPVLVQVRETLVYANREFEDLSGYAGIAELEAAGGLDALFVEREDGLKAGELAIRRSNGQVSDVRVHMQRVTFSGRSSLLMSFSPSPRDSAAAVQPVAEPAPGDSSALLETENLRQEVEELRAVLDTATDGVVLLDPAGTIRAMNGSAHALFGGGLSDHAGRHLSSLFAHESQKATHDYLDMLRDDGLAGILNDGREVIGRVAQGGFIPLFITIGRLSGERGWCVVMRDIAHWKRIEEDLVNARRQAEAASLHKSRFLANISHELRTPLNAIIGFADVMASECFGPIGNERYLEYLGDIKRSGHHVLDLVNDLLDISKIEAGKLDLAFEAVSLNEVVSEVVSLMQPQANRERVIVRSNLPSSVPPVVADRRTMRQIALNLVANAIRFTPAGGQIIASTTYTVEGDVLLRFRDSGIGMTEREIEIALTPFQQVHAPSVTRGEGTGLGLPLTKAMVEANRAGFAINSVPGEGTLVEITFPSQRVLAD